MEQKSIEQELFIPICLTDGIREAVEDAVSFENECSQVGERADHLCQFLFLASYGAGSSTPPIYQRPLRCILPGVSKTLSQALKLVRKCGFTGFLRHFTIITASNFQEIYDLLDASLADLNWVFTVFDYCSSNQVPMAVGLPPIAAKNPILSLVWSFIASIQMGSLPNRIEAAKELASFAFGNDRNKRIIVEEGGISPLLKLLKDGPTLDAQIAAASVLCSLATDQETVRQIMDEQGIPIIVQVLTNSVMRVQVLAANLISIMAENNSVAQEEFARANAISTLVSLLSFETFGKNDELIKSTRSTNLRSLPTINEGLKLNSSMQYQKENPDMKFKPRINCSKALWMLLRGCKSNSKRVIEAKGLFCLAKHIEWGEGEFQFNCLMSVLEIATAAEFDTDIQAALKINSEAVKAIVDQLLSVIENKYSLAFRIAAIKSIGSLALIFPANETTVIVLLVKQLGDNNLEIATEAIVVLEKFACSENYHSAQHSKAIVESNGVPLLMILVKEDEHSMLHGFILLCYLALHKECSEALATAKVLFGLEVASHSSVAKNPLLGNLIPKAIYHLKLYQAGIKPNWQS